MKNSNLKGLAFSVISAVIAGGLFFTVNAAFGNDPAVAPPGDSVSPTFSGLTVGSGGIYSEGIISTMGSVLAGGPAVIGGPLTSGPITAPTVGVTSTLGVGGDSQFQGNLNIYGEIINSNGVTDEPVLINDNLDILGKIFNSGMVGQSSQANAVTINDDLNLSGMITNADHLIKVDGSLELSGVLTNLGTDAVKINDEFEALKDAQINGNLTVNKKIKAASFGTYSQQDSAPVLAPVNMRSTATAICPTDPQTGIQSQLVSCGFNAPDNTNMRILLLMSLLDSNSCTVTGYNAGSTSTNLYASAVCLDPDL